MLRGYFWATQRGALERRGDPDPAAAIGLRRPGVAVSDRG